MHGSRSSGSAAWSFSTRMPPASGSRTDITCMGIRLRSRGSASSWWLLASGYWLLAWSGAPGSEFQPPTTNYQIPTTTHQPPTKRRSNRPRPAARSQQLSALHNRVIPIARQLRAHCLRFLRVSEGADLDVEQRIAGRGRDKYRILLLAQGVDQDVRVFLL